MHERNKACKKKPCKSYDSLLGRATTSIATIVWFSLLVKTASDSRLQNDYSIYQCKYDYENNFNKY